MRGSSSTSKLFCLTALAIAGCQPAPEAAPRRAAQDFLDAVAYRDLDGMLAAHIDVTPRSTYCTSEAFTRLLDRARTARSPQACAEARAVTQAKDAPPEAVLFSQILRYTCDDPRATCIGYAARVFASRIPAHPRWAHDLRDARITRLRLQGDRATAYVDLTWADRRERFSLRLSRGPQGWRVEHSPFDSHP